MSTSPLASPAGLTPEQRELLRRRAQRYARQAQVSTEAATEVIVFARRGGRYALPLEAMREIRPLRQLTRIPGASPVVPGLVHYRGELLGVHDLGAWVDAPGPALEPAWVLVVEQGAGRLGLLADELAGIERVLASQVGAVPVTLGERAACFQGVLAGPVLLLQPDRLFTTPAFYRAF